MRLAFLLALAVLAAGTASAATIPIADKILDTKGIQRVKLEFSAGSVRIAGTDAKTIRFHVSARCKHGSERCRERAAEIQAVSQNTGEEMWLRLEGAPTVDMHGLETQVLLELPRQLAVDVDMSAGELQASGLEGDVDLNLSVGEAALDMPEAAVAGVDINVSVGDASLRRSQGRVQGEGWLGRAIEWHDGPGKSTVRVSVSVGEARVRLR